jgi:hypothetical protein
LETTCASDVKKKERDSFDGLQVYKCAYQQDEVKEAKMKFWRTSANALVVVALAAMTYPAKAADTTKITYTYFEHPVEVPGGKVLPQGEYAFKMVDDSSPVKVIQILLALPGGTVGTPSNYNANKPMQVAATLVAVPDYRNRRGRGTVTYWQTRGGGPNALRTLSFPLDDESLEFAYPRARAADLAKAANQPVLSTASELSGDVNAMKNVALKAVTASGDEVDVAQAFGKPGDRPADKAEPPSGVHFPPGCVYETGEVSCAYNPGEARD